MEAKTNYTMVGLVVILLTVALVTVSLWLSVGFNKKKYNIYAVYTREAVAGLTEEAPVKFNGVQVGYVLKIELNPVDPQQVRLLLNIEEGTPITASTTATLMAQGITGTSYIGLSASSPDLTPLAKIPKEPYPIIPSKPSLFGQIDAVLNKVSDNITSVSTRLNAILDEENAQNLHKTLANLEKFTATVADNSNNINRTLRHTDVLMRNFSKASQDLPAVVNDFRSSLKRFTTMADELNRAGEKFGSAMDSGKQALDKITHQALPPAVVLLRRLDTIAANLEQVSVQMRQNPAVIIRGTTPPKPGPGERIE